MLEAPRKRSWKSAAIRSFYLGPIRTSQQRSFSRLSRFCLFQFLVRCAVGRRAQAMCSTYRLVQSNPVLPGNGLRLRVTVSGILGFSSSPPLRRTEKSDLWRLETGEGRRSGRIPSAANARNGPDSAAGPSIASHRAKGGRPGGRRKGILRLPTDTGLWETATVKRGQKKRGEENRYLGSPVSRCQAKPVPGTTSTPLHQ